MIRPANKPATPVHFPPIVSAPRVRSILARIITQQVDFSENAPVSENFTTPRHSSRHLQQINNLLIKSNAQDDLLLEDINTTLKSRDGEVYSSYVTFCEKVVAVSDERYPWAGPRTIKHWDSFRNAQTLTAPTVEAPYTVDAFVPIEKELEASRRCKATHPHRFGIGADSVIEDFSGYIWQNRQLGTLALSGHLLVDVSTSGMVRGCECLSCEHDRDVRHFLCWKRGIEQPITFDKHLARAAVCPALEEVNNYELTSSMVQKRPFGYWAPFEYRPDLKVKAPTKGSAQIYCKTCVTRTLLTEVDGVDVVIETKGAFVDQTTIEDGKLRPHTCTAPTFDNDSMSLDRLWGWLNHRVAHYVNTRRLCLWGWTRSDDGGHRVRVLATPRPWVYAHPVVEGDTQLAVPVVSRTLLPESSPLMWSFNEECTHGRERVLCQMCNQAHLTRCTQQGDYLAAPRCKHHAKRSFTFKEGNLITLCLDCGKAEGHEVLLVKNIVKPNAEMLEFYRLLLNEVGLSNHAGLHKDNLSYYASSTLLAKVHTIVKEKLIGGKRVTLTSWTETDGGGDRQSFDSSVRDHRAQGIVKQDRADKKAKTRDVRVARWCPYSQCPRKGQPFIDRPNKKYCSENCRKRHNEEHTTRRQHGDSDLPITK